MSLHLKYGYTIEPTHAELNPNANAKEFLEGYKISTFDWTYWSVGIGLAILSYFLF